MTSAVQNTTRTPVPVADYDSWLAQLRTFMSAQPQFSDYNFEGSGLSTIMELLSYNAYMHIMYDNLSINESFIASAAKRDSVVSHAYALNYLPTSATAPRATINIHVANTVVGNPQQLVLPVNTQFSTSINGVTYNFYTLTSYTTNVNFDGSYDFLNCVIAEGTILTNSYNFTGNSATQIPMTVQNVGCDTSTLNVLVYPAGSSTYVSYQPIDDVSQLDSTFAGYYIRETRGQLYEVYFDQTGICISPNAGSVVQLQYLVTNNVAANGASTFSMVGNSLLGGQVTITTVIPAFGGAVIESTDSVRINAPLSNTAQNRAIQLSDYKTVVKKIFPAASSINVWGGEDNIPPNYGYVYICIQPNTGGNLTSAQVSFIQQQVSYKNAVGITPVVVQPDQLYINVNTTVNYNPTITNTLENSILSRVTSTINTYNNSLGVFGGEFLFSNFSTAIDQTDPSIISNTTSITLTRVINPIYIYYGTTSSYSFTLGNPIEYTGEPEEAILSTGFMISSDTVNTYYIDDDGVGNLRLFYYNGANKTIVNANAGTVNYDTGYIYVAQLNISSLATGTFAFTIKPSSYDVVGIQTQILSINLANTKIQIQAITGTGTYPFASIRS